MYKSEALLDCPTDQRTQRLQKKIKTKKRTLKLKQGRKQENNPEETVGQRWCRGQAEIRGPLLSFIFWAGMPCQSLFIEGNDHLRAAHVSLASRNQVSFIRVFPARVKEKTTVKVGWGGFHQLENIKSSLHTRDTTHHFIKNISSPLLSVAPMIRSGSRFLANPRGFSTCGLGDGTSGTRLCHLISVKKRKKKKWHTPPSSCPQCLARPTAPSSSRAPVSP